MKARLEMSKSTWASPDGPITQYQVNFPAIAYIRETGTRYDKKWKLYRVNSDEDLTEQDGEYATHEEALAALQKQVDSE